MAGVARYMWRHPSSILLTVQLLGVLAFPFMQESGAGRLAFELFGAAVLALAVWAVHGTPTPTWISIGLGAAASLLSVLDALSHSPSLQLASACVHAVFYFYAAASLMFAMLRDRTVTQDELFGIGATFTLVAWAFAYVFSALQIVQPGCFIAATAPAQRSWMELLFLSFTNLTSTGLSDVVPVTGQSRSVVMIEQLAGLGYVALFVSRLVGLTLAWRMSHPNQP